MDHTQAIKEFIIAEFLPDLGSEELEPNYDLLAGGVIDSLGLLKVIAWLEDRFGLAADDLELVPDRFRTIYAIQSLISGATHYVGTR